jgi:hypothetical protein
MVKGTLSDNETEDRDYKLIPEGEYMVQIVDYEVKETRAGDPMIRVKLEIVENAFYEGKFLFDNIVFPRPGSKAMGIEGRSRHFLHCIGEPHEKNDEWDTDNWVPRRCNVEVKHNEYQDKMYANVDRYILNESIVQKKAPAVAETATAGEEIAWDEKL